LRIKLYCNMPTCIYKSTVLTILLAFISSVALSQTATITGVITDSKSEEALIGANVIVQGTSQGSTTDLAGSYTLKLEQGTYNLTFSYLGYETKTQNIQVRSGETLTLNIALTEEGTFLETTVISASKFERNIAEETVSLDVIKPSFLENQNIRSVDGALARNPGVVILDGQINIRGGSGYSYGAGSRVLILLDDIPVLQADAGVPPWGIIPIENIGQIEVIKGAASALYGSSAMNGVVNIRTAYPTSKPVTKLAVYTMSYNNPRKEYDEEGQLIPKDWWNFPALTVANTVVDMAEFKRPYEHGIILGHRRKIGKLDLVFGGQAQTSQGWRYGNFGSAGRVSTNLRYRLNERINFGINGFATGGVNGTFFLWNGNEGANKYLPLDLTGNPTKSSGFRASIDPFFNYMDEKGNRHKVLGRYLRIDNKNSNDQGNASDLYYSEYQYQRRLENINLTLSGGAVAQYVVAVAPLYGDTTLSNRNMAAYFQADKKFFDKLNVSLGLRVENNKQSNTDPETRPVFRLGANYQIAEYTFVRASVGQGYRFPTIAEKFVQTNLGPGIQITPNLNIQSETGLTSEIGFKQGLKIGGFGAYLDVAAFYTRFQDMIEFNPIVVSATPLILGFQSQNVGNTQIFGLETNIVGEGKLFRKFPSTLMLGYTFTNPKYVNFDAANEGENGVAVDRNGNPYNILKYRFRHTFTSQWDVTIHGFNFGVSGQYYSAMENVDRIFTAFIPGVLEYRESRLRDNWENKRPQRWYKGDFIVDLRLGYTFKAEENQCKISFLVNNVANLEYAVRPLLIEAPRTYTVRFDLEI
jgi:outer membrane receptor protein involved in Fe transport